VGDFKERGEEKELKHREGGEKKKTWERTEKKTKGRERPERNITEKGGHWQGREVSRERNTLTKKTETTKKQKGRKIRENRGGKRKEKERKRTKERVQSRRKKQRPKGETVIGKEEKKTRGANRQGGEDTEIGVSASRRRSIQPLSPGFPTTTTGIP
jgi:hypothetical protein